MEKRIALEPVEAELLRQATQLASVRMEEARKLRAQAAEIERSTHAEVERSYAHVFDRAGMKPTEKAEGFRFDMHLQELVWQEPESEKEEAGGGN